MNAPGLTRIDQPPATLRDMVQDKLRDAIIEGAFQPGERLVERPLCDQLGVSRTVIRETIRFLEAEGLVELLPGRGPIVANITLADARQIYDIRRMLETAAAGACATRITSAQINLLDAALRNLKSALKCNEPGAVVRASNAYYAEIFAGAEHYIAWDIVQRLNGRISRLRMLTLAREDRDRPGIEHMDAIFAAIIDRDSESAKQAVMRHLKDAATIAERVLAQEGIDG